MQVQHCGKFTGRDAGTHANHAKREALRAADPERIFHPLRGPFEGVLELPHHLEKLQNRIG